MPDLRFEPDPDRRRRARARILAAAREGRSGYLCAVPGCDGVGSGDPRDGWMILSAAIGADGRTWRVCPAHGAVTVALVDADPMLRPAYAPESPDA